MKRSRNQGEQGEYCLINLDYIFAEDNPLFPKLENKEKEIDNINSEDQNNNYSNVVRRTTQTHQEEIVEVDEDSSAKHTASGEDIGDDDDDDDDDDGNGNDRHETKGRVRGTSDSFAPNTYPYPYASKSQHISRDYGKSPIIEEEDETHEEYEEEKEELSTMDSIQRQSPGPTSNPNIYAQPFPPQYPLQAPPHGADTYTYLFGYPSQYGYGYGQSISDHNNNDNI